MRCSCSSDAAEEALEAEIGHHRRDDAAAGEPPALVPGLGDQRHDLVAVDDRAVLVDDDDAVGVAVERDADVGAHFMHLLLQAGRMGRAAFLVDVEAVGLDIDGDDLGAEFPQRRGRHLVGGAIGAIDDDPAGPTATSSAAACAWRTRCSGHARRRRAWRGRARRNRRAPVRYPCRASLSMRSSISSESL